MAAKRYLEALTKWVLQFSPTDDAAGDFQEGCVDKCKAFEVN
jgi:hypothetical protein